METLYLWITISLGILLSGITIYITFIKNKSERVYGTLILILVVLIEIVCLLSHQKWMETQKEKIYRDDILKTQEVNQRNRKSAYSMMKNNNMKIYYNGVLKDKETFDFNIISDDAYFTVDVEKKEIYILDK